MERELILGADGMEFVGEYKDGMPNGMGTQKLGQTEENI